MWITGKLSTDVIFSNVLLVTEYISNMVYLSLNLIISVYLVWQIFLFLSVESVCMFSCLSTPPSDTSWTEGNRPAGCHYPSACLFIRRSILSICLEPPVWPWSGRVQPSSLTSRAEGITGGITDTHRPTTPSLCMPWAGWLAVWLGRCLSWLVAGGLAD